MIVQSCMRVVIGAGIAACGPRSPTANDVPVRPRRIGSVERLTPGLDVIVSPDAAFEILADGHEWTEGPVWVPALRSVLYSDVPNNAIYRWSEGARASVWLTPSGYTGTAERGGESGSNGLALDPEGRLVLAQHGDRRIARLDAPLTRPKPLFAALTERFEG
jgi:gluconolactonase